MPPFKVNVGGQEFKVEAPNAESLPEIVETIARQQSATGQAAVQREGVSPEKFTGEIKEPPTLGEKITSALPSAGQFTGGLVGGVAGSLVGRPAVGAAIGGTAGRAGGIMAKRGVEQFKREPIKTVGRNLLLGPTTGTLAGMSREERKQLGKETLKAGAVEAVAAPIGAAASGLANNIGKGIAGALLGDRVAERGAEVGFTKILDPENFKGRLAKNIAVKASRFFNRLKQVAGKGVSNQAKKDSATFHNTDDIAVKGKDLLRRSGAETLDDLKTSNVSKAQFNKAKEIQTLFDSIAEKETVGTFDLWKNRKAQDEIYFNTKWDDSLGRYLKGLRQITNDPLLNTSDDLARSFKQYSFVRQSEDELGKSFVAIESPSEIFAPKVEQFASQTLRTTKDEQIRLLKELDSILPESDKVIEKLLNAAASEEIQKPISIAGVPSKLLSGILGGRKTIAGFGAFAQRPTTRAVKTSLGRGLVTGATELSADNK